MGEVEAAHARRRHHRGVFGERDADVGGTEQREQLELLAVIGTRRVTEGRTDAAVRLVPHVVGALRGVDAPLLPRALVEIRGERFREPIGERLDDDGVVIVVDALLSAMPRF